MLNVELADQPISRLREVSLSERLRIIHMIDRVASHPKDHDFHVVDLMNPRQYQCTLGDYRILFTMNESVLKVLVIEHSAQLSSN